MRIDIFRKGARKWPRRAEERTPRPPYDAGVPLADGPKLCNLCDTQPRVGRRFVIQVAEIGAGGRAWIDVEGEACAACAAELDAMKTDRQLGIAGVLGTCFFPFLAAAWWPIALLVPPALVAAIVAIVRIQRRKDRLVERVVDSPAMEPILERVEAVGTPLTWQTIQIHSRDAVSPSATQLDELFARLPPKRRLGRRGKAF